MKGGRYVWIEREDIEAIKHIANNDLEVSEEHAVERIIEGYWGQPATGVQVEQEAIREAFAVLNDRGVEDFRARARAKLRLRSAMRLVDERT